MKEKTVKIALLITIFGFGVKAEQVEESESKNGSETVNCKEKYCNK